MSPTLSPVGFTLVPVMACQSTLGWTPVTVVSHSDPDRAYNVWASPWNSSDEFTCECEGYYFRGSCKHQDEAYGKLCRWTSLTHPDIEQTDLQRQQKICPRCKGPTVWTMEEIEDA